MGDILLKVFASMTLLALVTVSARPGDKGKGASDKDSLTDDSDSDNLLPFGNADAAIDQRFLDREKRQAEEDATTEVAVGEAGTSTAENADDESTVTVSATEGDITSTQGSVFTTDGVSWSTDGSISTTERSDKDGKKKKNNGKDKKNRKGKGKGKGKGKQKDKKKSSEESKSSESEESKEKLVSELAEDDNTGAERFSPEDSPFSA